MAEIQYVLSQDGLGFNAQCNGLHVGEITFVRVGADKLIIDHTGVDEEYRNTQIGLNLVRRVCDLARTQGRRIIPLCPFAGAMFRRYPEFDDVRLMNANTR